MRSTLIELFSSSMLLQPTIFLDIPRVTNSTANSGKRDSADIVGVSETHWTEEQLERKYYMCLRIGRILKKWSCTNR